MKLRVLGQLAFFSGLSVEELQLLEPFFQPRWFEQESTVFEQGEHAEYLYLVVKGEVVIRYKPEDGPVMIVSRVQPGGVFGWSAAVGNGAYTSGAVCAAGSEVLRVRGSDLRLICEQHPDVGRVILDRLAAVIAERKQSQKQMTSFLANGIRQQTCPEDK